MKAWRLIIIVALFVTCFSPAGWSVRNPAMRNPAGYGTMPPSSYRNGLVSSPNPIDPTGNLLITGNVRRGMHFRGSVPYRSTTSFGASLGSSALNSFLRDTAGSEDFQDRSDKYRVQPFYSPTQTVTTMMPGRSEVFNPMDMRIDDRMRRGSSIVGNGLLGLESLRAAQTSSDQDTAEGDSDFQFLQRRYVPLLEPPSALESASLGHVSPSSGDIERLVPGQLGIRQERDVSEQSQERIRVEDRTKRGLVTDSDREAESRVIDPQRQQKLPALTGQNPATPSQRPAREGLVQYPGEATSIENMPSRLEMLGPADSTDTELSATTSTELGFPNQNAPSTTPTQQDVVPSEKDASSQTSFDQDRSEILDQIRNQLDALTESVETALQENNEGSILDSQTPSISPKGLLPAENLESLGYGFGPADTNQVKAHLKSPERVGQVGILSTISSLDELKKRRLDPRRELPGKEIESSMDNLASVESFSQSRFNEHISAAEDHLKAGRYYRAVDSFSLAAVYQPNNPIVLAGKGHALFAAGEYMSSALFLARALTVRPDYLQTKVDLTAMLGGSDKLAERIAEVEQWLARSGSAQLQFLLSYVYFRTGRLERAKQAIAEAHQKMPYSPAVGALRTAIERAMK
jgi:tetratricopeptide (TPR) repeat protein